MSINDEIYFRSSPAQAALRIDEIADRFESTWQRGTIPRIGDYLAECPRPSRVALLEELVAIDRSYRLRRGEDRSWDDYRCEYPELPLLPSTDNRNPYPSELTFSAPMDDSSSANAPSAAAATPSFPTIAGYDILGELGRGSMGIVYRARQVGLNRIVALKVILTGSFAGLEEVARFRLEAEAIARLQHPHIVQIYEIGDCNGLPYFALEFVEGGSLMRRINGVPQAPREAAALIATLAQATHAAHLKGIVHRDLKPSNVLLTTSGEPKIADFGLAKHLDLEGSYTKTGVAVGTPSYMAVEQAEGRVNEIGPATDVYALGAIFYEMVTGRPPFRGATTLETLEQVRSCDPVPPKRLQPSLPSDLQTICLKAMAREPAHRYPSADALADDLRRWRDGHPIHARRTGVLQRAVKWMRRRPALAALAFLAMTAAIFGISGVWWHTVLLRRALTIADDARDQAEVQRAASDTQRGRAEAMLYAVDVQLASEAYLNGDVFETSRRLERHLPTPLRPDRREFTWRLLRSLSRPDELEFHGHAQDVYAVRVMGAGEQLVTAGRDGTLRLWTVEDPTRSEVLARHASELNFVAAARDGVTLAVGSDDGSVILWNLAAHNEIGRFEAHANWVLSGAIAPQGDRLATGGRDNIVRLWSLDGALQQELAGHESTIESLAFMPDGRRLVSTGSDGTLRLWDIESESGSLLGTMRRPNFSVACAPDGKLLATGCEDHDIYLWDVESRSLLGRLTGHIEAVQCVEFSPDGARLASAGKDGSVRIWDIASRKTIESFRASTSRVWSVAWLPEGDGVVCAAGDGIVRLRRRRGNPLDQPLNEGPAEVTHVFLPDSDRCIWSVDGGPSKQELWIQSADGSSVQIDAPSPTRSFLANWSASREMDALAVAWSEEPPNVTREPAGVVSLYSWTGERLPQSLELTSCASWIALAPDAARLAVGCQSGRIEVFDVPSGRRCWARAADVQGLNFVQFNPTGDEVLTRSEDRKTLTAYSTTDGAQRIVVENNAELPEALSLALSPDNRQLATGGYDGVIRIWDWRGRNEVRAQIESHDGRVTAVAYSPDGQTLCSGTGTGTVHFWHVPTWQQLARVKTQLSTVFDLSFSPEGDALAIGGATPTAQGQVLLWKAGPKIDP